MADSVIGQLRVILGLDTAQFLKGASQAQKEMFKLSRDLKKVGDNITGVGKSMALGLTAPLAGAGIAIVKYAGDFEASMNKVQISTQATAGEMKAMNELALDLGKSTVFSASEASDAMDMLAKNGLGVKDILGGAAKAAIDLAAAAGTELDPAAAAITDTMQNFGKTTKDLPGIVNQITGAVNQSKFDFDDFRLAMGSAGGVAGKVGVSFEDFAASLAATSSAFSSGQDAGTSYKTFLTSLVPNSKPAAAEIERLGLKFFDATGKMLPMIEIADQLKKVFGPMSDEARNASTKIIFGADAQRTALALAQQGAEGFQQTLAKIGQTAAGAQAAARMKGFNAQMEQLRGSLETLAIKIGQSGVLETVTGLVLSVANLVDKMSAADPAMLKIGVTVGLIVAAMGPLLIVIGGIASGIGALVGAWAVVGPAFAAVIPFITAIRTALVGLAIAGGPLTLIAAAAAAAYLVWQNWDKIGPILARLYAAAKQWLVDKLGPIFTWVSDKAKLVGDAFYNLWDRVVGHSYVPDMVDGIAHHFARLQAAMVDPAASATETAGDAFRQLATDVGATLDRLFPFQAAMRELRLEKEKLDKALAEGLVSSDDYQRATEALAQEARDKVTEGASAEPITATRQGELQVPDARGTVFREADMVGDWLDDMHARATRLKETFRNTFSDGIIAALHGDAKGFFKDWFAEQSTRGLRQALDNVAERIVALFSGRPAGGGILSAIGGLFGGGATPTVSALRAPLGFQSVGAIGSSIPAFATGGSFKVGGRGGIDQNLVAFRATRGEMVNITKGEANDNRRGGMILVSVDKSDLFDVHVQRAAAPLAQGAQLGAVAQVEDRARRRQRTRL